VTFLQEVRQSTPADSSLGRSALMHSKEEEQEGRGFLRTPNCPSGLCVRRLRRDGPLHASSQRNIGKMATQWHKHGGSDCWQDMIGDS